MIDKVRQDFILGNLIKDKIKLGESLLITELLSELEEIVTDKDLSTSFFDAKEHEVSFNELSSASKFNRTVEQIFTEIKFLESSIAATAVNAHENHINNVSKYKAIQQRIKELRSRIENLLLLNKDTAGFVKFVGDNFSDLSKVDLSKTTANVDAKTGVVTLSTSDSVTNYKSRINNNLFSTSFKVLSAKEAPSGIVELPGSSIKNALSESDAVWHTILRFVNSVGRVSVEVLFTFENKTDISSLFIDLHGNVSSGVIVTVQHSEDGYNWYNVDGADSSRNVINNSLFVFKQISPKYLRLILTKETYDYIDAGFYHYEFGAKEISIYHNAFVNESVLYSKPLSLFVDDTKYKFTGCSLQVCQKTPGNSKIKYEVSFDDGTYQPIGPLNTNTSDPLIATVSNTPDYTRYARIDQHGRYDFKSYSHILLTGDLGNPRYSQSDVSDDVAIKNSMRVWRNCAHQHRKAYKYGIAAGWGYDGIKYYSCYFYLNNTKTFDFGTSACEIDGKIVTGSVTIKPGVHKFRTSQTNWFDVSRYSDDVLAPYNHKNIIEGLSADIVQAEDGKFYKCIKDHVSTNDNKPGVGGGNNQSDCWVFVYSDKRGGELIWGLDENYYSQKDYYQGADLNAELLMTETSLIDFESNIDSNDYSKFAIVNLGHAKRLIVNYDIYNHDANVLDELFVIQWKEEEASASEIKLKATLISDGENYPTLGEYMIKLGNPVVFIDSELIKGDYIEPVPPQVTGFSASLVNKDVISFTWDKIQPNSGWGEALPAPRYEIRRGKNWAESELVDTAISWSSEWKTYITPADKAAAKSNPINDDVTYLIRAYNSMGYSELVASTTISLTGAL